ncbi:hypothetical protein ACFY2K_15690 [Kitasatospora sp. NPDC001309]
MDAIAIRPAGRHTSASTLHNPGRPGSSGDDPDTGWSRRRGRRP